MSASAHEEQVPLALSPEELAFRASLEGLIDFYRVEQASALWRAFWPPAFIFLPLGSVLTALAMGGRVVSGPAQAWLVLVALLVTGAGPLWAIVTLLRSIGRDDRYVAIFLDGLRVRLDAQKEPQRIAWDALDEVQCDGRVLRLEVRDGAPEQAPRTLEITSQFAELTLEQLAARVRHGRRLALWGRLSRDTLAQAV